ncbi:MAG: nucleoside-diphosphate kinase [Sphingomonadales bacterium]|nr:nucleoside-diphosphate kinase [Sphingomonadales bacterium]NCO50257.1 nucleoside-diphosphate kinase [Sphingomonadales bacterium]NCP00519.1 nucleoside-diphosphate kinase [Sphingomonadales bacterium]NCP26136.1 nucleoside-diphosphate kinase [Sphingomonadales bacterium]NCP43998.1 nucleoside-diphosphate kinase [Sphingomonadales bacterium]
MSVAFRREGDDEHLEPKFELPIPVGPNLVTARGLRLIKERVATLQAEVAALTDETPLKIAKRDLRYWNTRQSMAELPPVPSGDKVAFGTRVIFLLNGKKKILSLVGDDEANPASALVSFSAPISRALIGLEAGDFCDFAGREDAIEILSIEVVAQD